MTTLLLRNSDAETFEDSNVPFLLQLIKLQAPRLLPQCLCHSVRFFGSADGGSAGVVLFLGHLGLEVITHFDGMEGVVDGSAVRPAPGSRCWVVQHPLDGLHRQTIWYRSREAALQQRNTVYALIFIVA